MISHELRRQSKNSLSVSELKSGRLKRLSQKPIVKQALAGCGKGVITQDDLYACWPTEFIPFVMAMGVWGEGDKGDRGWDQTSRNQYNLVLRLNFSREHDAIYHRLVELDDEDEEGPFENFSHPISAWGRHTLAWVRMDIDLATNEVLIEEVQNDWLRYADSALRRIKRRRARNPRVKPSQVCWGLSASYKEIKDYVEKTLAPYKKIWAEASLCAAINFIKQELGISTIFYHTYDTGMKLKCVSGKPPRSIYTAVPNQFCFKETGQIPEMLLRGKYSRRYIKAIKDPKFYLLQI